MTTQPAPSSPPLPAFKPHSRRERGWGEGRIAIAARGPNDDAPTPQPSPAGRSAQTRRSWIALFISLLLTLAALPTFAQIADPAPLRFANPAEEQRFHALVTELRCVMCQNQSLADSNAQIAHDLRREILTLMRQGDSDDQIRDYLVARYGEFVLYKPRIEATTWLLWFGPVLLLLIGGVVVARVVRRHAGGDAVATDDRQEW
jgi:cytochrome c-type biogenesis protein CcmH